MADDIAELIEMIEAHDHHQGARELRIFGARRIVRRLTQVEVKREQRREEIVLKAVGAVADFGGDERFIEKIEKGLMRIERGDDKVPRPDELAVGGLDADRASAFRDDALRLGHQAEFAAAFAHR